MYDDRVAASSLDPSNPVGHALGSFTIDLIAGYELVDASVVHLSYKMVR